MSSDEKNTEGELASEPVDVDADESNDSIEDTEDYLKGLIEAILFVTDRPLTLRELARACKVDKKRTGELVEQLVPEFLAWITAGRRWSPARR
jgi:hypothetical protein